MYNLIKGALLLIFFNRRIKMKKLPDELVEKFLKKYWRINNLQEIYEDINVNEFIKRAFKGYIDSIQIIDNRIFIKEFIIFSEQYDKLAKFLRKNNLTMEIGNPKSYYEIYLSIKKRGN